MHDGSSCLEGVWARPSARAGIELASAFGRRTEDRVWGGGSAAGGRREAFLARERPRSVRPRRQKHSREWLGRRPLHECVPHGRPTQVRASRCARALDACERERLVPLRRARADTPPLQRAAHTHAHITHACFVEAAEGVLRCKRRRRERARGTSRCPAACGGHRRGLSRALPRRGPSHPGARASWSAPPPRFFVPLHALRAAAAATLPASPWGACWR